MKCKAMWLLLALLVPLASPAQPPPFSTAALVGNFTYRFQGEVVVRVFRHLPAWTRAVHSIGQISFDGAGNCRFSVYDTIDGTRYPPAGRANTGNAEGSCTYAVNPDGSAAIRVTVPDYTNGVAADTFIMGSTLAATSPGAAVNHVDFVVANRKRSGDGEMNSQDNF